MNSFAEFLVPQFIPRTLDELTPESDEVTSLVYLEDSIAKEVRAAGVQARCGCTRSDAAPPPAPPR